MKKGLHACLWISGFMLGIWQFAFSQASAGPVIVDFGAVYDIESPDFRTDTSRTYRVVFDLSTSPEGPADLNPAIATLARFLNMHARAGVAPERMQLAAVFHGAATYDALTDEAHQKRYGVPNPNLALIQALREAGVKLYICGQSLHSRGVERAEVSPGIGLALSAMTVLVTLQADGYQLISW